MILALVTLAWAAPPDLFVWVPSPGQLAIAVTAERLADGSVIQVDLRQNSAHHVLECSVLSDRRDIACVLNDQPLGQTTWGSGTGPVFAGPRIDPEPTRERGLTKRRRADRSDRAPKVVRRTVDALVVVLPTGSLGGDEPLTVQGRILHRSWSPDLLRWSEAPGCAGNVEVRVEPDPWSSVATIRVNEHLLSADPHWVTAADTLVGTVLTLDEDPAQTCAIASVAPHILTCGGTQLAVHTLPQCASTPTDRVLYGLGRPSLADPEAIDPLDRLDDNAPATSLLSGGPLLVDPSHPCSASSPTFLENERAFASGRSPATCGGRTPGGGAIDTLLALGTLGPVEVDRGAPLYGTPSRPPPRRTNGVVAPLPADAFPWLLAP